MKRQKLILFVLAVVLLLCCAKDAYAGEQGHYYPGVISVRDVIMPPKGIYLVWYNPYIFSDKYKDRNGDTLENITMSGSLTKTINLRHGSIDVVFTGTLNADIDAKLDAFTTQPMFAWVTGKKFLGADYGIILAPSFGYARVKASANVTGTGTVKIGPISRTVTKREQVEFEEDKSGLGDLFVVPVWLSWHKERFDIAATYGFYAPVGAYDKEDAVNVGFGYWTHQIQANGIYYLTKSRATALMAQATYGYNTKKRGFDIRAGQTIDLEYGLSQYVHPRVEVAVAGYNHWQITDDTGNDAKNKDVHDRIGGIGPQLSVWAVPQRCYLSARYMWEYGGKDHFQGNIATANLTLIF